jgi:AcrR family transcriptional regulator
LPVEQGNAVSPPLSGHDIGKLRRRRAILDAARDIITTLGEAGLNMRAMAARAGVSPATPYNLFGSKQAVLQAVYDEDQQEFYRDFEAQASKEPLTRLFDMIDLSIAHWLRTPEFHKALIAILYRGGGSSAGHDASRPRLTFVYVQQLVADAVAAEVLRADTPVAIVTATLARIFRAAGQEWIDGALTLEQARDDLGRSFALVLAGLVTPASRDALTAIGRRYERGAAPSGRAA